MAIRTLKHGYIVTTYPCNNGYVSEVINKYGVSEKCKYSFDVLEARNTHNKLLKTV